MASSDSCSAEECKGTKNVESSPLKDPENWQGHRWKNVRNVTDIGSYRFRPLYGKDQNETGITRQEPIKGRSMKRYNSECKNYELAMEGNVFNNNSEDFYEVNRYIGQYHPKDKAKQKND